MSFADHMLLDEQTDKGVDRRHRMGRFPVSIGVIREEIRGPITERLPFRGRGIETTGKDFVQFDRHARQSQPQLAGMLIATLLDPPQIPALANGSLTTDPVADLDRLAFLEFALQNQFARTAAALTMEFKPAPADGPIRQQHGSAGGGGTVMQDAASGHREGRLAEGGGNSRFDREPTAHGAVVSMDGRLAWTTSV